jgi:hypothetical protein
MGRAWESDVVKGRRGIGEKEQVERTPQCVAFAGTYVG